MKIGLMAMARAAERWFRGGAAARVPKVFRCPDMPRSVIDPEVKMAVDSCYYDNFSYLNDCYGGYNAIGFLGFPILSEMAQRPEYRKINGTIAREMFRKGLDLFGEASITGVGRVEGSTVDRIARLRTRLDSLAVSALLEALIMDDRSFGRSHVFVDTGEPRDSDILKVPMPLTKEAIKQGSLKAFRKVEPIWCYPLTYNSNDPLAEDFFEPQRWAVMQREIHRNRLLTFVSQEVPDILKPAYAFGGLSMTQMSRTYVDNWLRTRDSVGDLVHSFSLQVLATNMGSTLAGDNSDELFNRADMFNQIRDNRGLMLIDKESEQVEQLNTPLSGLDDLQAQAQEQMCSISSTPVIKLLGLTPKGLNTSTEGEIDAWNDFVSSCQQQLDPLVVDLLKIMQLDMFGDVDPAIKHKWLPLKQLDGEASARVRLTSAQADQIYMDANVVSQEEVRRKIADDPDSGYDGIDPDDVPEPPDPPDDEEPEDPDAGPQG